MRKKYLILFFALFYVLFIRGIASTTLSNDFDIIECPVSNMVYVDDIQFDYLPSDAIITDITVTCNYGGALHRKYTLSGINGNVSISLDKEGDYEFIVSIDYTSGGVAANLSATKNYNNFKFNDEIGIDYFLFEDMVFKCDGDSVHLVYVGTDIIVPSDQIWTVYLFGVTIPLTGTISSNQKIISGLKPDDLSILLNEYVSFRANWYNDSTPDINTDAYCSEASESKLAVDCDTSTCIDCLNSFAPLPGGKYVVSAWVNEEIDNPIEYINSSLSVTTTDQSELQLSNNEFYATGEIIDGWQRIEGVVTIPSNAFKMHIGLNNKYQDGTDVYFDDVRFHPFNGSMKSYVYDPITFRLMAELDDNNYATFYEYDEEGKLIRVKKETERGVMTIQESTNNIKNNNITYPNSTGSN